MMYSTVGHIVSIITSEYRLLTDQVNYQRHGISRHISIWGLIVGLAAKGFDIKGEVWIPREWGWWCERGAFIRTGMLIKDSMVFKFGMENVMSDVWCRCRVGWWPWTLMLMTLNVETASFTILGDNTDCQDLEIAHVTLIFCTTAIVQNIKLTREISGCPIKRCKFPAWDLIKLVWWVEFYLRVVPGEARWRLKSACGYFQHASCRRGSIPVYMWYTTNLNVWQLFVVRVVICLERFYVGTGSL